MCSLENSEKWHSEKCQPTAILVHLVLSTINPAALQMCLCIQGGVSNCVCNSSMTQLSELPQLHMKLSKESQSKTQPSKKHEPTVVTDCSTRFQLHCAQSSWRAAAETLVLSARRFRPTIRNLRWDELLGSSVMVVPMLSSPHSKDVHQVS